MSSALSTLAIGAYPFLLCHAVDERGTADESYSE